jgi:hypothetical protein
MPVRNEDWILGASLRVALEWCDGIAIYLDRSTDDSVEIIRAIARETGKDIVVSESEDGLHWNEMHQRQRNLEDGRNMDASHFAIIDADEILTANHLPNVREWFASLKDGQVLDVPMIAPWKSLDVYSPNTQGIITLGWKDQPGMGWAPRGEEQYHHHNRPPHGMTGRLYETAGGQGGIFHLQWASEERVTWKHRHYMMSERVRWGYHVQELNEKYHWWNRPPHGIDLAPIPVAWWGRHPKRNIILKHRPWYEWECKKLVKEYGWDAFDGLDLFGWGKNVA